MTEPDDEAFAARSLAALPPIEPSRDLLRRVAQIPIEHPRQQHALGTRHWVFGLLAAALLGLAAGWVTLGADDLQQSVPPIAATSEAEEELEGMLALALGSEASSFDDEFGEQ
jgi:hypothetical protein